MGFVSLADVGRDDRSVLTVGTFDGVHLGHQALLRYLLDRAKVRGGRSVVITFDPHPRTVIHGDVVPLLSTVGERADFMRTMGVETVVVIPFTREFARKSAESFVREILVDRIGLKEIVIGYDFTFGHGRTGDASLLQKLSEATPFSVDIVPAEIVDAHVVSSRRIRHLLTQDGDVAQAREMLGRAYGLSSVVVRGEGRGRTIGYPTANLRLEDERKAVPRDGVYAVQVKTAHSGETFGGMMNIGKRPTFGGEQRSLEVHIFDFDRRIYGENIHLTFQDRIRDERRFTSKDELAQQLSLDERRCRDVLIALS